MHIGKNNIVNPDMAESSDKSYNLIVVGAGMMGSAAAYHASAIPQTSVCLVGPAEPKSRKDHYIHGCWYDAGRICSTQKVKKIWNQLTAKALERFDDLQKRSGIDFFKNVGFLNIHQRESENSNCCSINHIMMPGDEDISQTWREKCPYLNFPEEACVIWNKCGGHLDPRKLVSVHKQIAKQQGTEIVEDIVHTIEPSSSQPRKWKAITESGKIIVGEKVLVATGGYASLIPLFQHVAPGKVPKLELRTQTVAFLKVKEEEAMRLRSMPDFTIIEKFEDLDGAYVLPPIKYPDGNWYLKLGHLKSFEEVKETLDEVTDWYHLQTGFPECVRQLSQFLCHLIPDLKVEGVTGDGCLTSSTPDVMPYIDLVTDGFGIALGGNGYGAQCCNEIGRLAAQLTVLDQWDSEIPREKFKIVWES
ncbi:monomeric sarcosine oxidase-like isoform X1 [Oratosquilla oratoria]|uniref:monomeric sarcosine oxidase-like isoform X1 n=2 Tax=Oratosquilla oratoria TaxID=337810 RepID=UPI003F76D22D